MNLYKLHSNPSSLIGHDKAYDVIPELVWELIEREKKLNSRQLQTLASNADNAYYYARDVIKGRFPEGEKAIANNAHYAYSYAKDVIKGRWPEGEKASISSDVN